MENNHQDIFIEAAQIFFLESSQNLTFYQMKGGVNNWSKGCSTSQQEFVIRVYNNGKNIQKVKIQHEVLLQLQKMNKSFRTPQLRKIPGTQQTIAILKSGHPCCVARKIQGSLPKNFTREGLENFGRSVSQISYLLSRIKLSQKPLIKPYHELYAVHPAITKEKFHQQISSHKYDSVRQQLTEKHIEKYHQINLPTQIIHGDVHNDNILVIENKVNAILDFEFIAEDWRVMEFAISLSKFVNFQNSLQIIQDLNKGYSQFKALTQQELRAIPWLIILRIVSNFVYFVGRVIAKQESVEFCKQKIQLYCQRVENLLPRIQEFRKVLLAKD